jgi:hypothetical protein
MREKGVDASNGLRGILSVHLIFRLAVLFGNREDAQSLDRCERVGGFWMEQADASVEIVAGIREGRATGGAQDKVLENDSMSGREQCKSTVAHTGQNGDGES